LLASQPSATFGWRFSWSVVFWSEKGGRVVQFKGGQEKRLQNRSLEAFDSWFSVTLNQKFCNGIAAVCGVCRA
jgi:hypothetical protein